MGQIEGISTALAQLSEEQVNAAVSQVDNQQLNRQTQPLDFDTATERLRTARDAIQAALDDGLLASLPVAVQQELLPILQSIGNDVTGLVSGTNTLAALAAHVDQLHVWVWRNRIAEKTPRIVNYKQKTDQLAALTAEAQRLRSELENTLKQAADIQTLLQQSRDRAGAAGQAQQEAENALQQASQSAQQAQTALTEASVRNTQVDTLLGQAQTSRQQISTFEEDLKALYNQAQEFRRTIAETQRTAQDAVNANTAQTETLLAELAALKQQVDDALERATGVSLFYAFEQRRKDIAKWKWIWPVGALCAAGVTIYLALRLALTCSSFGPAFYFKLAVTVPVALIIWFCVAQYNRERRLEEEYAFKSKVSLSLEPYRKLVAAVLPADNQAAQDKYSDFVIDAVGKVFTAPADHRGAVAPFGIDPADQDRLKEIAELFAQMVHIALQGKK